jgi:hypothetical protein
MTRLAIYTPHDNDGPRLSCHQLVRHSTSFLPSLMPPPPRHPILGRGPCIRLTPAPTPTRAVAIACPRGRFTSYAYHRFHRRRTPCSSSRPSPCSSSPTCYPPRLQPRADRRSLTRVRGESIMLLAFLRVCRRGGHGGVCHA